jgi:Icc-related predicted phosphoesterase
VDTVAGASSTDRNADGDETGCVDLRQAVARVRPRLHVFGHIHEGYGQRECEGTQFVNAANCTLDYEASQAPVVVELTRR